MNIILGILSVLLIAAILLTPKPKTKEEKLIQEQDKHNRDDVNDLFF